MNIEIKRLLDKALEKGVILFNEKDEILKKGIELGLDSLELEMYIENYQSTQQKIETEKDTKKCPKCNANIPFLSNVCNFCGAELTVKSNQISDKELVVNIHENIEIIKRLRTPTIYELLLKYGVFFFGFLSVVTVLITLIFFPGSISFRVVIYVILGIVSFYLYKRNDFASKNLIQKLENTVSAFEKNQTLFKLYYTNNREIQELTVNFNDKVNTVRNKVKQTTTKTIIIFAVSFIVLFGLSLKNSISKGYSYLDENDINTVVVNPKNVSVAEEYKDDIQILNNEYKLILKQDKFKDETRYYVKFKIILQIPETQKDDFYFTDFSLIFANSNGKKIKHTTTFEAADNLFKEGQKDFNFYYYFPNITHASEFISRLEKKPYIIISAKKKDYVKPNSMNNETGTITDIRDNHVYKTIKIGTQTWFAENLDFDAGAGSWTYNTNVRSRTGRLYDYKTAKKSCPKGWHLPTDNEWKTLITYLGGEEVAGEKLKNYFSWVKFEYKNIGTNSTGFSAIPCGFRRSEDKGGEVAYSEYYGYWWTATSKGKSSAWIREINHKAELTRIEAVNKNYGYSVRCIKNN